MLTRAQNPATVTGCQKIKFMTFGSPVFGLCVIKSRHICQACVALIDRARERACESPHLLTLMKSSPNGDETPYNKNQIIDLWRLVQDQSYTPKGPFQLLEPHLIRSLLAIDKGMSVPYLFLYLAVRNHESIPSQFATEGRKISSGRQKTRGKGSGQLWGKLGQENGRLTFQSIFFRSTISTPPAVLVLRRASVSHPLVGRVSPLVSRPACPCPSDHSRHFAV